MKALIVEDELPAVENLIYYLKGYPLEIAGVAHNLKSAVRKINKINPDVVFLDINLSGENGFDLFEKVDARFHTIFVTAYDTFALRAFEVNALDYILKPMIKERIAGAMSRLLGEKPQRNRAKPYDINDTIFLSEGCKASFCKISDICYIEADSCYSMAVLANQSVRVVSHTLKRWEEILPQNEFIRVHRSFIINKNHIREIKKRNNGTYIVLLNSKTGSIDISRRYASSLRKESFI